MFSYIGCSLLLASLAFPATLLGEVVFRCPSCTAERQAACPKLTETCAEIVREPGCGCCPVCARQEGELCGVYTPRCSSGLRCYPKPDSELPLEQLVKGLGRCGRKVEAEPSASQDHGGQSDLQIRTPSCQRRGRDSCCVPEPSQSRPSRLAGRLVGEQCGSKHIKQSP